MIMVSSDNIQSIGIDGGSISMISPNVNAKVNGVNFSWGIMEVENDELKHMCVNTQKFIHTSHTHTHTHTHTEAAYENPPHIYTLTDDAFRNMLIETENQFIIIRSLSSPPSALF